MTSNLRAGLAQLDLNINEKQFDQLSQYRDRLAEAAQRFNLTAVRQPEAIEQRHLLESLAFTEALAGHAVLSAETKVLDLGSGAGLPGLPMGIALPALDLSLLEARAKSCEFLRQVIEAIGLEGTQVIEGRAEEIASTVAYRECFDLVVARAVAPLPILIEYALPLLRLRGHLATTKGSASRQEVSESGPALSKLGGELAGTEEFAPPKGQVQTLVLVQKTRPTPERYPRRPGAAAKQPIK